MTFLAIFLALLLDPIMWAVVALVGWLTPKSLDDTGKLLTAVISGAVYSLVVSLIVPGSDLDALVFMMRTGIFALLTGAVYAIRGKETKSKKPKGFYGDGLE